MILHRRQPAHNPNPNLRIPSHHNIVIARSVSDEAISSLATFSHHQKFLQLKPQWNNRNLLRLSYSQRNDLFLNLFTHSDNLIRKTSQHLFYENKYLSKKGIKIPLKHMSVKGMKKSKILHFVIPAQGGLPAGRQGIQKSPAFPPTIINYPRRPPQR